MGIYIKEYSREKGIQELWEMFFGIQKLDNLIPSNYLLSLVDLNVNGLLDRNDLEKKLDKYYKDNDTSNQRCCDYIIVRMFNSFCDNDFIMSSSFFSNLHGYLYKNLSLKAGKYRQSNITKSEPILNGANIDYTNYERVKEILNYYFKKESMINFSMISYENKIKHFAEFASNIWQVHPFEEGSTKVVILFMLKYLKSLDYGFNYNLFKQNSLYFRNALVMSNYSNPSLNISPNFVYLINFYEKLLIDRSCDSVKMFWN